MGIEIFVTLLSFIVSFLLVAFMLPRILLLSLRKRLVDPIDPRKVHTVPASRLGGLTFYPSIIFATWFSILLTHILRPVIGATVSIEVNLIMESLALLLLFMIGAYDDVLEVAYKYKFIVQIAASLLIVVSGTYIQTLHGLFGVGAIPSYVGVPMTLIIYVFVINAINLIDGIDGLASLLSIMALFVYGIILLYNREVDDAIFAIAALGSLVPFFCLNFFGVGSRVGSKIFMGDTGALVVGGILGFLAVKIWNISYSYDGSAPIESIYYILAYTMLLVPCLDVLRVVIHRYRSNKPLFQPDRSHIHHKFIALGCTSRVALLWILAINMLLLVMNILLSLWCSITYIFVADILVWTLLQSYISSIIVRRSSL